MVVKLLVPVAVLVGLNYVFNELMDESGLHVLVIEGELASARHNATALSAFRAIADAADLMGDPSGTGALRFELSESRMSQHKEKKTAPIISATLVHRQRLEGTPTLPRWLIANPADFRVDSVRRLRTVFPERARWHIPTYVSEPGSLREVGRLALLVQQTTHSVEAEAADVFRRSWTDLGYNALSEPGVVRCDLLQSEEDPTVFVARKVFRHAAALESHEASEHYMRWRETVTPALQAAVQPATKLLDTLYPRTSVMPFRSRWATE